MGVIHHQQQRALAGDALHQPGESGKQALLFSLLFERRVGRQSRSAPPARGHSNQIGQNQRRQAFGRVGVGEFLTAQQSAFDDLRQRRIGSAAVGVALAQQGQASLQADPGEQLFDQARLADARLARNQQHAAFALQSALPEGQHFAQLIAGGRPCGRARCDPAVRTGWQGRQPLRRCAGLRATWRTSPAEAGRCCGSFASRRRISASSSAGTWGLWVEGGSTVACRCWERMAIIVLPAVRRAAGHHLVQDQPQGVQV